MLFRSRVWLGPLTAFGLGLLTTGCSVSPATVSATPVSLIAQSETTPALDRQPSAPLIWVHPEDAGKSRIYALDEDRGIEAYALSGERLLDLPLGRVQAMALLHGFRWGGQTMDLLAVADADQARLLLFEAGPAGLRERPALALETRAERICLHRHPITQAEYLFVIDGSGTVFQHQLYASRGALAIRLIRSFAVGGEVEACATDERRGALFLAETDTALWRYDTDPEAALLRTPVDLIAPLGAIESVTGLAVVPGRDGSLLLAIDEAQAKVLVYGADSGTRLGAYGIAAGEDVDGVQEPESLAALAGDLGSGWPNGLLVVHDADNESAGPNFKLLDFGRLLTASGASLVAVSPREAIVSEVVTVTASVETEPVQSEGDAADDPAIWVHPTKPSASLVIGTQKQYGLVVYDLTGRLIQSIPAGRLNNVDLRDGFDLNGRPVSIVAASNRSDDSIALYRVDPRTRRLVDIADGRLDTGFAEPYGLCLYQSAASGDTYVFVNDTDGRYRQWRLVARPKGKVGLEQVREFALDSQPEGCVADDSLAILYAGEEGRGVWKLGAEPASGAIKTLVDTVGGEGNLVADVEGMALWTAADGQGFLVVSSQGEDAYAVYERASDNRYLGKFRIVANDLSGIDGASETDGLEITSTPLGKGFEQGLLVVQDGRNVAPPENQNFKLVPWSAVAEALKLR